MHLYILKRADCILIVDVFQFKFHLCDHNPHFATLETIVCNNMYA